ncbi:MAG: glutamate 5-kinase [Gammaproteobacteria bacterium]|nr:glutamate 5-kinase [Gammaproteobacteria bacterium]
MKTRQQLGKAKRWVIKVGSSLVTRDGQGLDHDQIAAWVEQICDLREQGHQIVLVSSGSVAEGLVRLGWNQRPEALNDLQAAAAVGQMGLVQAYESRFQRHGVHTAQVLFTHEDMADRNRYLNARSTLNRLLDLGVVPVVNENDTVAVEEIRFGDNDRLAALAANLIEADLLVLLTDQAGMYDSDPRQNPDAQLLESVSVDDDRLEGMAAGSGAYGRGGMITKIQAARLAARSGAATLVVGGQGSDALKQIADGEVTGTLFNPVNEPMAARKQWLAGHMVLPGKLQLDDGAVKVLKQSGRSLLPVGVKAVFGSFHRGSVVACIDSQGREIARGLVNYNSQEVDKIKGQSSSQIKELLGYVDELELIHRDNLVLVG